MSNASLIEIAAQGFGDPEPCFFVQGKRREIVTGDLNENRAFMIRRTGAG